MAGPSKAQLEQTSKAFIVHRLCTSFDRTVPELCRLACVLIFVWGMIRVAESQPAWVGLVEFALFYLAGKKMETFSDRIQNQLKGYMSTDHQRLKSLEEKCDPTRDSSGLKNTGEGCHDDIYGH